MPKLVKPEDELFERLATEVIRVEMIRRRMTFAELNDQLRVAGVRDNDRNIRNKIARGTFSAAFFLQCLMAMGITHIDLVRNVTGDSVMGPRDAVIEMPKAKA